MTYPASIICPEDIPIWGNPKAESEIEPIEPEVESENERLERSFVCSRCGKDLNIEFYTQIAIRSSRWPDRHGFDLCPDCEDDVVMAVLMVLGKLDVRDSGDA